MIPTTRGNLQQYNEHKNINFFGFDFYGILTPRHLVVVCVVVCVCACVWAEAAHQHTPTPQLALTTSPLLAVCGWAGLVTGGVRILCMGLCVGTCRELKHVQQGVC